MYRKLRYRGTWYPSDNDELDKLVRITPNKDNKYIFGVVPHAGLHYSASLIKLLFDNLSLDIKKILLITPSHYYMLKKNIIGSGNFEKFETPYGDIKGFNLEIFEKHYENATIREHAVEMILPFIAQMKNTKLCCAHINEFTDIKTIKEYATKILENIDDSTAVIASSDFTHYGSNFGYTPLGNKINDELIQKITIYDREIANKLIVGDISSARKISYDDKATICGIAPMLLISEMARIKNLKGKILGQSNSLEKTIYDNNFVSYLTLGWSKQ
ncbi:MAG: AmmeMemoRadiSam system protein B [Pleomorphochaeta sp.]